MSLICMSLYTYKIKRKEVLSIFTKYLYNSV